jgi:rhodanese-related sulfurtransferase
MVLVGTPVGFADDPPTLPLHCQSAKILRGRARKISPVWSSGVVCGEVFSGRKFRNAPLVAAEGVSPTGFLALDTLGAFLWSGFYVGLGYAFANQLDIAIGWVKHFGIVLGTVVGLSIALYAGWRGLLLLRMIRRLRVRRMTPRMLARKLKSGNKVAVLDLLDFEATESASSEAIPGAFRVDPSRLRHSPHLTVPDNVDIVLYSSSGGDTVPARAAMGLKRIGVNNVWVLEGGLKAWREQGFPLSESPELAEVAAARVGVKLQTP